MVTSLYAALVFTVTSKHANGDSCTAPSACSAAAANKQAGESENCRPFALGDPFAPMDPVAVGGGDRQAGNRNCVASKRVSIVLGLEEQGREVGSTLRQPRNTRANPADE